MASCFSASRSVQISKFCCSLSQGQEQPQEPEEVEQEEVREPEIQTDTPAHADAGLVKPKPLEGEKMCTVCIHQLLYKSSVIFSFANMTQRL